MRLEFSRAMFWKYSSIKFHGNPSSGSRVVPCGRTDRHDEANTRLSQFCEGAKKEWAYLFSSSFPESCACPEFDTTPAVRASAYVGDINIGVMLIMIVSRLEGSVLRLGSRLFWLVAWIFAHLKSCVGVQSLYFTNVLFSCVWYSLFSIKVARRSNLKQLVLQLRNYRRPTLGDVAINSSYPSCYCICSIV
jgi:hypothetical protein